MTDPNDVLVDAVKEAYRRIERLVMVSLGSAVWLLIVSQVNPTLSPDKSVPKPDLPFGLSADVPVVWLALIALAAYFVSGVLLFLYYRKSRETLGLLRQRSLALFEAASAFPSFATLSPVPRLVGFLALGGLGILAISLLYRSPGDFWKGLWAGVVLASPYIILFFVDFWNGVRDETRAKEPNGHKQGQA